MPESKIEKRKIMALKPHPRQREFFREITDAEIAELAPDIEQHGIRNPPHILPDNTILIGHRRICAASSLNWDQIEVVVRYDLEGNEDRASQEFITDNLYHQQLDPIAIAKCYEEVRAIERRQGLHGTSSRGLGELRDQIASRLPMRLSGRQLDRLRRLLKLPLPIQDAIREGMLRANHGDVILGLSENKQQEIAAALEDGDDPVRIVQRFSLKNSPTSKSPNQTMKTVLKSLDKALPMLQDNLNAVDSMRLGNDRKTLEVLKAAAEFFVELHRRWQSRSAESAPALGAFPKVGFRQEPDKMSDELDANATAFYLPSILSNSITKLKSRSPSTLNSQSRMPRCPIHSGILDPKTVSKTLDDLQGNVGFRRT